MKNIILFNLIMWVIFLGCEKNTQPLHEDFTIGRNNFTTKIDGDVREYIVHVPEIYDKDIPVPVVFMLHGSGGSGNEKYNTSGWKELGEKENIITVFPTSWSYCTIEDGIVERKTKWHVYPGKFEYCDGEVPRNDIKFLKKIIDELNQNFNIDNRRIHLAGHSNGGRMAYRCAVEMSDIFASIVESAGSYLNDTFPTPRRDLPITFQLGNSDNAWFGPGITIPMNYFDSLLTSYEKFRKLIKAHVNPFHFESTYTLSGNPDSFLVATYNGIPDPIRKFNFVFIKDLDHDYPNGVNHPIYGAEENWKWMKQYTLK